MIRSQVDFYTFHEYFFEVESISIRYFCKSQFLESLPASNLIGVDGYGTVTEETPTKKEKRIYHLSILILKLQYKRFPQVPNQITTLLFFFGNATHPRKDYIFSQIMHKHFKTLSYKATGIQSIL